MGQASRGAGARPGALPVRAGVLRQVGAVRAASQKPAAIWTSEKFLKITWELHRKAYIGVRVSCCFVFPFFFSQRETLVGDGGSKLALAMLFVFRTSLGSPRWLLARKRKNLPSNLCADRARPRSVHFLGSGAAGAVDPYRQSGEDGCLRRALCPASPDSRSGGRVLCWRGWRTGSLSTGRCVA